MTEFFNTGIDTEYLKNVNFQAYGWYYRREKSIDGDLNSTTP